MRLNQIRDFVAVVEAGSLRAAARKVGVSQPAITKSVRQLEQELRVQLLQRNARGASVTRAGKAFLSRARVIQVELRKAQDDLQNLQGGARGSVAFGIAPAACMLVAPDALTAFRRGSHAGADVRIVEGASGALVGQVRDETLDFFLGQSPKGELDAALRFRPLFRPVLAVVGRRGHPLRNATALSDLADASWLMFYPIGTGAMLERMFAAAGMPLPKPIVHCESFATAVALVSKTDLLALMSPHVAGEGSGLQVIDIREKVPSPLLGLYMRADAPLTPAAAAMAQAVTAIARRLARP